MTHPEDDLAYGQYHQDSARGASTDTARGFVGDTFKKLKQSYKPQSQQGSSQQPQQSQQYGVSRLMVGSPITGTRLTNRTVPRPRTRRTSPKVPLSPSNTPRILRPNSKIRNRRSRTNSRACLASSRSSATRSHRKSARLSIPRRMPSMAPRSRRRRTGLGALLPRVRATR